MKNRWSRFGAAAVLAVSGLVIAPSAAGASEKCAGWSQTPLTVGVGGNPVATTPFVQVRVCREDTTEYLDPNDLPSVSVTDHSSWRWDPEIGADRYATGRSIDLYVPAGASISHVSVTYAVGTTSETTVVPIGIGGGSGQTICLVYEGDAERNPGGCLFFVED